MFNVRWPIVIEPHDDELFSSWIFRLALANGQEPSIFHRLTIGGANKAWNQDIDVLRNASIINQYSSKTGIPSQEIYKLLLHNLLERLAVKKKERTNSRWLIPLNNRKRNLSAAGGIPFCSLCLKQDGYFKQCWRLATTTVCIEHGIYLKEHCQNCRAPVILKKVYFSFKNCVTTEAIFYCVSCGFDLRKSRNRIASQCSIKHNKFNSRVINTGYIDTKHMRIQYSHLYFEVASVLSCILFFRKSGIKVYNFISSRVGIYRPNWSLVKPRMRTIENMPLNSRDTALQLINCLIGADFQFKAMLKNDIIMPSILHMTRDYQPFWYISLFERSIHDPLH